LDEQQKLTLDGMYDAEVAYQDAMLGDFFDRLRTSGQLDNTLVIICADHGEHLGEKQFMGHSLSIYNELVRVPLIIRDPAQRFEQGTTVDDVVSTRRLFHTVLGAAELANESELALDLVHSQDSLAARDYVFAEAIPPQNVVNLMQKRQPELVKTRSCDRVRRAVWMGNHKLIETEGSDAELYDVLEDPTEALDLSAILPENVEVLQDCLQAFAHRSEDQLSRTTALRATDYDDPEVRRRLEELGYLED
ncbi:MAG: sulfatase-like hydrolase/transferase, partial [Leptolyngbyaceae cyanobacterium SM2_3_12]|nr:sulfatase-like hydrolase/transferase [Leptolyngbyaceae cyanobacterium SM2_3_12]